MRARIDACGRAVWRAINSRTFAVACLAALLIAAVYAVRTARDGRDKAVQALERIDLNARADAALGRERARNSCRRDNRDTLGEREFVLDVASHLPAADVVAALPVFDCGLFASTGALVLARDQLAPDVGKIIPRRRARAPDPMPPSTGTPGETGATGATGPPGPAGPPGPRGARGARGPAGAQGEEGPAGAQGPAGATGARGEPGARGEAGPSGSAQDLAPVTARVVSVEASLAALTLRVAALEATDPVPGPPGPAGPPGPTGPAGPPLLGITLG